MRVSTYYIKLASLQFQDNDIVELFRDDIKFAVSMTH